MFCDFNWQETNIKGNQRDSPKERWGHRLIKVNSSLILFGGFGGIPEGQGNYLNDLWKFDLVKSTWEPLNTTGDCPEPRSNYTIHFDEVNNQVIVFGGGATNKIRYNTLYLLNLQTNIWRKVTPLENSESPWERTYHCSEFSYPYLVMFGGEGVSNIDLDDTWIFDVRIEGWVKLNPKGQVPVKRRFAGSALVGQNFYIVGGCNDNYNLVGDIYRLSLKPLFQGKKQNLEWQCVIKNNTLLQRWGHSCDVFNDKIYIFAGRVSSSHDNSDFLQYNPFSGKLQKITTKGKVPKPRRRHGSAIVGDCLVILGGYNGNYLKDFYYLKLENNYENSASTVKEFKYCKQLFKELRKFEDQLLQFDIIEISVKGKQTKINTDLQLLTKNAFFKNLLNFNELFVELPSFCSIQIFRCINIAICKGVFCLSETYDNQFYSQIIQSLSYFCCQDQIKTVQQFLISKINSQNNLQMLDLAITCDLEKLNHFSSLEELKKGNHREQNQSTDFQNNIETPQTINSQALTEITETNQKLKKSLQEAYNKSAFQIEQKLLKSQNRGIVKRTKYLFKSILCLKNSDSKVEQISRQQDKKERCCIWVVFSYMRNLWSS